MFTCFNDRVCVFAHCLNFTLFSVWMHLRNTGILDLNWFLQGFWNFWHENDQNYKQNVINSLSTKMLALAFRQPMQVKHWSWWCWCFMMFPTTQHKFFLLISPLVWRPLMFMTNCVLEANVLQLHTFGIFLLLVVWLLLVSYSFISQGLSPCVTANGDHLSNTR